MEKVTLNISGMSFVTTVETLSRFPLTRLGKLNIYQGEAEDMLLDVDEEMFREVLRYHRTGELHAPRNMCQESFNKQLMCWGISANALEECCQNGEISSTELEKQFEWFEKRIEINRDPTMKDKIWYFLTDPLGPYTAYRKTAIAWALLYTLMVVAQTLTFALFTTSKEVQKYTQTSNETNFVAMVVRYLDKEPCNTTLRTIEVLRKGGYDGWLVGFSLAAFFITEIGTRFISCPQKKHFFRSIHLMDLIIGLVELTHCFITIGYYITATFEWIEISAEHRNMCLTFNILHTVMVYIIHMRCIRILHFASVFRFKKNVVQVLIIVVQVLIVFSLNNELQVLLLSMYKSRKEILLLVTVLGVSCLLCGPLIYYMEMIGMLTSGEEKEMTIDSVPRGYWWVVVTMTTVGYGDYYPKNGVGYAAAIVVMILGLVLTALPMAIIGTNFTIYYEYNKKRILRKKKEWKALHRVGYPTLIAKDNRRVDLKMYDQNSV